MKLHRLLILSGLLLTVAPATSHAGCSPACAEGVSCRITSQGPPTVYQCASGIRAGRGPTGPLATKSGVAQTGGAPTGAAARTTGPKNTAAPKANEKVEIAGVKSPRDAASGQAKGLVTEIGLPASDTAVKSPRDTASGQATGRRQHKP